MPDQAINNKQYKYILIALLLVTGFIIFKQMRPYLGGFLGAFTIYIILRGQLKYLVGFPNHVTLLRCVVSVWFSFHPLLLSKGSM